VNSLKFLRNTILATCLLTGEFKLRSGQVSNRYFDKYQLESNPEILSLITNEMINGLSNFKPDIQILAGLETGGIPIATVISHRTYIPMIIVRKKAKDYGTCKFAEGVEFKGKNVLIIEDVITTGGQVISSGKMLQDSGANIIGISAILTRSKEGVQNIEKELNAPVKCLFDFSEEI
jgi:orotate phosphoribosyltransferase